MRFLIFIFFILTSCRTIDVDILELMEKSEIKELNRIIEDYKDERGYWPNDNDINNLRLTNDYLKRFSKITLTENSDSSLNIICRLQYKDFEDPIRALNITEVLTPLDSGRYTGKMEFDSLVLQDNIQVGHRSKLTREEKKKVKKWDRLRIEARQLTIENTKTKAGHNIKVGTPIYLFSRDSTLMTNKDYLTNDETNERLEWIISTINSSDSTMNIDRFGSRRLVKFSDIDSLGLKSRDGKLTTFRIVGVNDTAHNKIHMPCRGLVLPFTCNQLI